VGAGVKQRLGHVFQTQAQTTQLNNSTASRKSNGTRTRSRHFACHHQENVTKRVKVLYSRKGGESNVWTSQGLEYPTSSQWPSRTFYLRRVLRRRSPPLDAPSSPLLNAPLLLVLRRWCSGIQSYIHPKYISAFLSQTSTDKENDLRWSRHRCP